MSNPKSEATASDHSESESGGVLHQVEERLEKISALTLKVQTLSQQMASGESTELLQLVMQRGVAIQELMGFLTPERLMSLEPEACASLQEKIAVLQSIDKPVQAKFEASQKAVSNQIQAMGKGQRLLQRYHLPVDQETMNTRSDDA